ncbi:hypothetical protein NS365_23165 [Aureimonas ureilytica]|uniref:Uncharacterized protein n=1 Tax=Aureimonas ureilytica TaxID=401562 RepID=A0A175RDV7_9HYPH|nr:hypothetical protein NS365_23165 [Aureimonas ureilytica]
MGNAFTRVGCADRGRVSQNGSRDSEFRLASISDGVLSRFFDRAPYAAGIIIQNRSLSTL